jgi:hypothetical protein
MPLVQATLLFMCAMSLCLVHAMMAMYKMLKSSSYANDLVYNDNLFRGYINGVSARIVMQIDFCH